MTKYIHYKNNEILISDNVDETPIGYVLYMELDCEKSIDVIHSVIDGFKMTLESNVIKDEDVEVFGRYIHDELAYGNFRMLTYKVKIHCNGYIAVYSRAII